MHFTFLQHRVGGMEEEGYFWHIVDTWFIFDNEYFYNYVILVSIGRYRSDQRAGGTDFKR